MTATGVIANIGALVDRARTEDVPVIWVQHNSEELQAGSEAWAYVDELSRDDAEPLIQKEYGDSFADTELETVLAERGVGRLVVTGAQTDACIRVTLHGALVRGYDATLVTDAHTTDDLTEYGAPAARPGDRPHQPVLEGRGRAGTQGIHGRHRRGRRSPDRPAPVGGCTPPGAGSGDAGAR